MPETLEKLRPDRDLQCYFERPSAVAAMSEATGTGFVVSGTWRQQFDWAVVEWNRDNVFEHPLFRNLPDGDLSGLTLSYEETRSNCIGMDSDLFPTVDWPYLRIWAEAAGVEHLYKVRLRDHATAVEGSYVAASAEFELQGTPTAGDYVGLSWAEEQYNYQVSGTDTLESAAQGLADAINTLSATMEAARTGTRIRISLRNGASGANGNRLGVYGFVSGARTEVWSPTKQKLSGGASPAKWRVQINFGDLRDENAVPVPTQKVRKMRWTYSAALQDGAFARSEFSVRVSAWSVGGSGRTYRVAGPGSRRVEDEDAGLTYGGSWVRSKGNFSEGTIRHTTAAGSYVEYSYYSTQSHELYLGTRFAANGAAITVTVDGSTQTIPLAIAGEDVLARIPLGPLSPGAHTVRAAHSGIGGKYFYFDFLEIAIPRTELPAVREDSKVTLATDWDTDHSISLPAERTAWMIDSLGFHGRVNHYTGALWFYELTRQGHQYASGSVTFAGTPAFSGITTVTIGRTGMAPEQRTVLSHINRIGDTAETIATAFALRINGGYTGIRATASGGALYIYSRSMGADGNEITIEASPNSGAFTATTSGPRLTGGLDGEWRTDIEASPRLNRAVRDWSRAFFSACKDYGLDVVAAFSMELQHGDPSAAAGIAQRYPDGAPVLLNTPALQTNFGPQSTAFWRQVYREMAQLQVEAGLRPYLQFGEVQWWYFPYTGAGLPFWDAYTRDTFRSQYGREIAVIAHGGVDPALHPEEAAFLPGLIGAFTNAVMAHVRTAFADCRFEVLYPPDVNEGAFNAVVNYPSGAWTPASLECLKTESFTYTLTRDLDKSERSMEQGLARGFPRSKCGHLVGISDSTTAWLKEARLALSKGVESVVLFALDQFCLVGYEAPLEDAARRSLMQG